MKIERSFIYGVVTGVFITVALTTLALNFLDPVIVNPLTIALMMVKDLLE